MIHSYFIYKKNKCNTQNIYSLLSSEPDIFQNNVYKHLRLI